MNVSKSIVSGDANRVPLEPSLVDLLTWSSPERASRFPVALPLANYVLTRTEQFQHNGSDRSCTKFRTEALLANK